MDVSLAANEITARLFESGQPDWSNRVDDAVAGATTGTEALIRLRHVLRDLLAAGEGLDEELRVRCQQVIDEVTRVLES